jgi:hypothetical protein
MRRVSATGRRCPRCSPPPCAERLARRRTASGRYPAFLAARDEGCERVEHGGASGRGVRRGEHGRVVTSLPWRPARSTPPLEMRLTRRSSGPHGLAASPADGLAGGWTFRVARTWSGGASDADRWSGARWPARSRPPMSLHLPVRPGRSSPRLPERQRTAVVLRFVADLTENQIAQAMASRSTVSSTPADANRRPRRLAPRGTRPHWRTPWMSSVASRRSRSRIRRSPDPAGRARTARLPVGRRRLDRRRGRRRPADRHGSAPELEPDTEVATQPASRCPPTSRVTSWISRRRRPAVPDRRGPRISSSPMPPVTHARCGPGRFDDRLRCLFADEEELVANVTADIRSSFRIDLAEGAAGGRSGDGALPGRTRGAVRHLAPLTRRTA